MLGPSPKKLILTTSGVVAAAVLILTGIRTGYIVPIIAVGLVALAGPFLLALGIAAFERARSGPVIVPSMPSAPALDPDAMSPPRPASSARSPGFRRIRGWASTGGRRQISTRLPY